MGLRYAQTGSADDTSHWALLLAYFQASQVAEFITAQATYDELRGAGDLELISDLDIRNALARYYNFGAAATLVERPTYRERVRGIIPMDIQAYIWDSCYESSQFGNQRMFEGPSPVSPAAAREIVDMLTGNSLLMEQLRYCQQLERGREVHRAGTLLPRSNNARRLQSRSLHVTGNTIMPDGTESGAVS